MSAFPEALVRHNAKKFGIESDEAVSEAWIAWELGHNPLIVPFIMWRRSKKHRHEILFDVTANNPVGYTEYQVLEGLNRDIFKLLIEGNFTKTEICEALQINYYELLERLRHIYELCYRKQ